MSVETMCEDCAIRAGAESWRMRVARTEARLADMESARDYFLGLVKKQGAELAQYIRDVKRQHEQLSVLRAERDDLQLQLRDALIRNDVLKWRLLVAVKALIDAKECPTADHRYTSDQCAKQGFCEECWRDWLEQEVQP